jgi:hypothetical protein
MVIFIWLIELKKYHNQMTSSEEIKVKTTWLLPKSLVKQLKQYALDNDTTLTATVMVACNEFLVKRKKK